MTSSKDRSDTASLLTVDEITQEVENRRTSMNLAAAHSGWVVDEDGVPIPLTARNFLRSNVASSIAGSTRPGSHRSISQSTVDTESELERRLSDAESSISVGVEDITQRPTADAPGEELDRHLGDPMARLSDDDDPSDGLDTDEDYMDADEDDNSSGDEGDGKGGVYHSAAPGREPIKWIKGALIGAGSFGSVYLGMNAKSGLLMAVKQVELPSSDSHSDQRKKSMLEALEREIELLKTIQHENIVQYLDSYADATHLNIFLEYVPGGSVAALLRNYGAFEEPLVRNFVKQILHGLSFLHSQDIVHRDIKGANILVDNKSCIKISDFGISKKTESGLYVQHRPSLQGSVFWMAPEVVKQTSYTRKADIWSLGCLVVEMISGTHPWANLNQMQALYQIGSHAKPAIPDEISPAAIDFLNKTFELDHLMRPSAEELLEHPFITEEYSLPTVTSPTT
jgi:mitogen-activated protein kinase kinase kinase